jgi:hypothetical protein
MVAYIFALTHRRVYTLIYIFNLFQIATKLGCEAAIHTTRTFVNNDQNRGKVLLKLDFKNAFNSVERDCILKEVQCHTPLLYPYL